VNGRVHSEISAIPSERLVIEREVLRPLPSLRLDIGPAPVLRKVDRLSCVRLASARYSVPTRAIGQSVQLTQAGGQLLISDPTSGEVLAEHTLVAPRDVNGPVRSSCVQELLSIASRFSRRRRDAGFEYPHRPQSGADGAAVVMAIRKSRRASTRNCGDDCRHVVQRRNIHR